MVLIVHFQIAGAILIILAMCHMAFPRYFNWRSDTAAMSLMNRQMFYVHSFFIALGVFLNGALFIGWPNLLVGGDTLAKVVLTGAGVFWLARLFVQLFVYDRRLWRGNVGRTVLHVVFTCLWSYLGLICGLGAGIH